MPRTMQLSLPLDSSAAPFDSLRSLRAGGPCDPVMGGVAPPDPALSELSRASRPARPDDDATVSFIRHRKARRYVVRVDSDGHVRVTIPRGGSKQAAAAFLERQREWVARQRARVVSPMIPASDRAPLRARALRELPPRLLELARVHGMSVSRVSIRNQRTRWGSCGRNGHITLNWRLVVMPEWVSDYVMVHELMHLRRLDHSPAYWTLVAAACPQYLDARRWLRAHAERLR